MGTSAARILPISAGSISAWITCARGAKVATSPVTRSSKRAPTAIRRSARCRAATADTVPCIPGIPKNCGCVDGNAPKAMRVVTTGIPVSSANSLSSCAALALITPPPTYSTGAFAEAISWAACAICRGCGMMLGLYPGRSISGGNLYATRAFCTSLGISTSTGPGRPVDAK